MVAETRERVVKHTSEDVNQRIRQDMKCRVAHLAGDPAGIRQRLRELDREWDIERALETGSATLTLAGLALGILSNRRWLLLSLAVQGFFMQHAIQGWCPPLPLFRRLGIRTAHEIEAERHALKALLGEYRGLEREGDGDRIEIVQRLIDTAMQ